MCITEYNEKRTLDQKIEEGIEIGLEKGRAEGREEGRTEGRAEGKAQGIFETLGNLVEKGYLTLKQAAEEANMTISEFEAKTGLKA